MATYQCCFTISSIQLVDQSTSKVAIDQVSTHHITPIKPCRPCLTSNSCCLVDGGGLGLRTASHSRSAMAPQVATVACCTPPPRPNCSPRRRGGAPHTLAPLAARATCQPCPYSYTASNRAASSTGELPRLTPRRYLLTPTTGAAWLG